MPAGVAGGAGGPGMAASRVAAQEGQRLLEGAIPRQLYQIDHVALHVRADPAFEGAPIGPYGNRRRAIAMGMVFGLSSGAPMLHRDPQIAQHVQDGMGGLHGLDIRLGHALR